MTLIIQITHGRLYPNTGGTDLEGHEVDDWGFDGPTLLDCTGIAWTYGEMRFCFTNEDAAMAARLLTGWDLGHDVDQLTPEFESGCLKLRCAERERFEYFGDWDLFPAPPIFAATRAPPSFMLEATPTIPAAPPAVRSFAEWSTRNKR